MKKWIILLTLFCAVYIGLCRYQNKFYIKPDIGQKFRIYQSYIQSSRDSDITDLYVIICDSSAETDSLFNEIETFYIRMNGIPNKMVIHLYKNKCDFESGNEFKIKILEYDQSLKKEDSY